MYKNLSQLKSKWRLLWLLVLLVGPILANYFEVYKQSIFTILVKGLESSAFTGVSLGLTSIVVFIPLLKKYDASQLFFEEGNLEKIVEGFVSSIFFVSLILIKQCILHWISPKSPSYPFDNAFIYIVGFFSLDYAIKKGKLSYDWIFERETNISPDEVKNMYKEFKGFDDEKSD